MNENTVKFMYLIEKEICRLEDVAERAGENMDLLKSVCRETLGFREHCVWHINFNADILKDNHDVFTSTNCYTLRMFRQEVQDNLQRMCSELNLDIDIDELRLLLNKFIIDKEKGLIK